MPWSITTSVNDFAAYAQTGGKITVMNDALGKSGIRSGKIGDTATSRIDVRGGVTATSVDFTANIQASGMGNYTFRI